MFIKSQLKFLFFSFVLLVLFQCAGDGVGVNEKGKKEVITYDTTYSISYDTAKLDIVFDVIGSQCGVCHKDGGGAISITSSEANGGVPFNFKDKESLINSIFSSDKGSIFSYRKADYEDATQASELSGKSSISIPRVSPKKPYKSSFYLRVLGDSDVGTAGAVMPQGGQPIVDLANKVEKWINSVEINITMIDTTMN